MAGLRRTFPDREQRLGPPINKERIYRSEVAKPKSIIPHPQQSVSAERKVVFRTLLYLRLIMKSVIQFSCCAGIVLVAAGMIPSGMLTDVEGNRLKPALSESLRGAEDCEAFTVEKFLSGTYTINSDGTILSVGVLTTAEKADQLSLNLEGLWTLDNTSGEVVSGASVIGGLSVMIEGRGEFELNGSFSFDDFSTPDTTWSVGTSFKREFNGNDFVKISGSLKSDGAGVGTGSIEVGFQFAF